RALAHFALKQGGRPEQRVERLLQACRTPLHSLPRKLFVKNRNPWTEENSPAVQPWLS
ncbi:MAG: hypothetical protein MHM6MM_006967, partial [Cercozoa sp. M6MM]